MSGRRQDLVITLVTMLGIVTFTAIGALIFGEIAAVAVLLLAVLWLTWDRMPMHDRTDEALDVSDRAIRTVDDVKGRQTEQWNILGDLTSVVHSLAARVAGVPLQPPESPVEPPAPAGPTTTPLTALPPVLIDPADRPTLVQVQAPTRPDFQVLPDPERYGRHAQR